MCEACSIRTHDEPRYSAPTAIGVVLRDLLSALQRQRSDARGEFEDEGRRRVAQLEEIWCGSTPKL
jgi:hypothetical protein